MTELRGSELADFPLQRSGILRGETVYFDRRDRPGIGNVQAAYDTVERTVKERLGVGGIVDIYARNVDLQAGSLVDFSGGVVNYTTGFIDRSQLLTANGEVINFSDASPDRIYSRLITRSSANRLYVPGYQQGRDAGELNVYSQNPNLQGSLNGSTTVGQYQRLPGSATTAQLNRLFNEVPLAGLLRVGADLQADPNANINVPDQITITPASTATGLSEQLLEASGIKRLKLNAVRVALTDGVNLELGAGADVSITANSMTIDGDIHSAGGTIKLSTRAIDQNDDTRNSDAPLILTGTIDTQGGWINDNPFLPGNQRFVPLYIDGGTVTLKAEGDLDLQAGSVIDVGSGAYLAAGNRLQGGKAGSITLSSQQINKNLGYDETQLRLDGELRGFAMQEGGSLTLTTAGFRLQDQPGTLADMTGLVLTPEFFTDHGFGHFTLNANSTQGNRSDTLIDVAAQTTIDVRNQVFSISKDAVMQVTGTDIDDLKAEQGLLLPPQLRSATTLALNTTRGVIDFGVLATGLHIGEGSLLQTEANGRIALGADDRILIEGRLRSPGGEITVTRNDPGQDFSAQGGIWLSDTARLDAAGISRVLQQPLNALLQRTGEVLNGGKVELTSHAGYLVLAPTSQIDVSGSSDEVDVLIEGPGVSSRLERQTQSSAGGIISLSASEGILPYAEFSAASGGNGAAGGTLSVNLDVRLRRISNQAIDVGTPFPVNARVLGLGAQPDYDAAWFDFDSPGFDLAFGNSAFASGNILRDSISDGVISSVPWHGRAVIDPSQIAAAGFDAVTLRSIQSVAGVSSTNTTQTLASQQAEIRLLGDVDLQLSRSLVLDAAVIGSDGGQASLRAPYVVFGSSNQRFPVSDDGYISLFAPGLGAGTLRIQASVIDIVGNTSLQGFAQSAPVDAEGNVLLAEAPVIFQADNDIRLRGLPFGFAVGRIEGTLASLSDITLQADQVYTTSLSNFTVSTLGTLGILGNGRALIGWQSHDPVCESNYSAWCVTCAIG